MWEDESDSRRSIRCVGLEHASVRSSGANNAAGCNRGLRYIDVRRDKQPLRCTGLSIQLRMVLHSGANFSRILLSAPFLANQVNGRRSPRKPSKFAGSSHFSVHVGQASESRDARATPWPSACSLKICRRPSCRHQMTKGAGAKSASPLRFNALSTCRQTAQRPNDIEPVALLDDMQQRTCFPLTSHEGTSRRDSVGSESVGTAICGMTA